MELRLSESTILTLLCNAFQINQMLTVKICHKLDVPIGSLGWQSLPKAQRKGRLYESRKEILLQ